jgi:NodT family efflux transporter outer membrane factor (OMF) lipoprotein
VDQALEDNPGLLAVWDRLAQAEASARRTRSDHYPGITASGSSTRTMSEDADGNRTYETKHDLGLAASYEIDLWGAVGASSDAADLDLRASEQDVRAAAITLTGSIASTWYQLIEQQGQVELLSSQLKINEEVLKIVTLRFKRGQVFADDVFRQRQLVESSRGQLATAQGLSEVLLHELAILIGKPPKTLKIDAPKKLITLPPLPSTGVPSQLVQRRPDVLSNFFRLKAANARVAGAVADRFPSISLSASATTEHTDTKDLFDNWFTRLVADLFAPIFDAGKREGEVRRTRAAAKERLRLYSQAVLRALADAENALVRERRQRELIGSLEKQLELSRQVIESARRNYTNGAADYLRVLEALVTYQSLERTLLQRRRELIDHRISLCRALAGGWEMTPPISGDDDDHE